MSAVWIDKSIPAQRTSQQRLSNEQQRRTETDEETHFAGLDRKRSSDGGGLSVKTLTRREPGGQRALATNDNEADSSEWKATETAAVTSRRGRDAGDKRADETAMKTARRRRSRLPLEEEICSCDSGKFFFFVCVAGKSKRGQPGG
ncbi:hypothetical protein TESG_00591 [Trichophyton tonsurans CBS 112818]|uniref:Uncharacterized protein n=1 Tax=Trichophyton tonsurans (strain CBS 112818) TaxID=647933 RepID=F2RNX8_TRIT1|nr:hypothetical protein TESG_00591 [Trichophyton tonsurans CBS 112818]